MQCSLDFVVCGSAPSEFTPRADSWGDPPIGHVPKNALDHRLIRESDVVSARWSDLDGHRVLVEQVQGHPELRELECGLGDPNVSFGRRCCLRLLASRSSELRVPVQTIRGSRPSVERTAHLLFSDDVFRWPRCGSPP